MNDIINLEKLKELLNKGVINETEFDEQKRNLFAKAMKAEGERNNPKSGIVYILLAWFLGTIGIHNFYAGYVGRGVVQLILTLSSPFFMFLPLIVTALWAFAELLFQNKSRNGARFGGRRGIIRGLRIAAVLWFMFSLYQASLVSFNLPVEIIDENDLPPGI